MTRQIAVIADAHLTDLYGGYGLFDPAQGRVALRGKTDSFGSTRLFNESRAALVACLADITARGIRDVVLLGDMTDDGQPGALRALRALLDRASRDHGLQFYAVLGNHDCAGTARRPLSAALYDAGGDPLPDAPDQVMLSEAEMCAGLAPYGFARPRLWQEDRSYIVTLSGVWLLMLDANVWSSDAKLDARPAWDAVCAIRPGLVDRIAQTVRLARRAQVQLIAFSHYPMIDFVRSTDGAAPPAYWSARMPATATSEALAATGLGVHVSGHLHLANRAACASLHNIAVPSPVSFPGGYGLLTLTARGIRAERVPLRAVAGIDVATALYGGPRTQYAALLGHHFAGLVKDFYLPRDLPCEPATLHHHRRYRQIASGLPHAGHA